MRANDLNRSDNGLRRSSMQVNTISNTICVSAMRVGLYAIMLRLHLIHIARIQVVSTCIYLYRLSP